MTGSAVAGSTEAMAVPGERPVTPEVVREHHLNDLEYQRILELLGRVPTLTELGIFSALWSEHCSYKHSRPVLRTFPTSGPQVVQGPGENAGVLRLPDGWAVAFKIESHNHPSAVEPYQGAAASARWTIPGTATCSPAWFAASATTATVWAFRRWEERSGSHPATPEIRW